eukprot:TRINITY_DN1653_c0_g1_i1.p1 TRINITY_DN1653_c0_g1~~TRINITY_DN1653_c0_g1_i1.p1  ORF type:complete len:326 (-),score=68.79 TRINITY_DN1653_c0_g1_i1:36-938(-)
MATQSGVSLKALPEEFSYPFCTAHRYEMPRRQHEGNEYGILVSNGFLKLFTLKGRIYWVAQTEQTHTTPDWKLHFSVAFKDIPRAWDLLAWHFIQQKIPVSAMKSIVFLEQKPAEERWPKEMRGRELTVYIYKYHPSYKGGIPSVDESGAPAVIALSPTDEREPQSWLRFVADVETLLAANHIESNGCADGDLPLGRYASLRNEAYVLWPPVSVLALAFGHKHSSTPTSELCYPPNAAGWNAAYHEVPFSLPTVRASAAWACARQRNIARTAVASHGRTILLATVFVAVVAVLAAVMWRC